MEIRRDVYLDRLIARMGNGMIKVVTGIRRCGKSYLLMNLFEGYLRDSGVDRNHIIEIALDDDENEQLRDPKALSGHLRSRIADQGTYYVFIDEIQYAISKEELRDRDNPPRLYGVLNGLMRLRNVDVYVTGSNSKLLSTDVMTEFRGRGDEIRIHPLSFSEFMQAYEGDVHQGWRDYAVFGGMPLTLSMRTREQKISYLENLFAEAYFKDIIERNGIEKSQELEDIVNVLAANIGSLTSYSKLRATFKSVLRSRHQRPHHRHIRRLPEGRVRRQRGREVQREGQALHRQSQEVLLRGRRIEERTSRVQTARRAPHHGKRRLQRTDSPWIRGRCRRGGQQAQNGGRAAKGAARDRLRGEPGL